MVKETIWCSEISQSLSSDVKTKETNKRIYTGQHNTYHAYIYISTKYNIHKEFHQCNNARVHNIFVIRTEWVSFKNLKLYTSLIFVQMSDI